MDKEFDLQLFADEGGAGDGGAGKAPLVSRGAGSQSETEGMGRSFERSIKTQPGGGIPSVPGERTGDSSSPRQEPLGDEGGSGKISSLQGDGLEAERDRAARDGEEDGTADGASGMPRPTDAQLERNRAAQVRDDDTRVSSALKEHFRHLEAEAEQMREVFPGFDLRRELRDPRFAALTAPGMGVSVEDAYYALHRRELQAASMQVAAQRASQKLASSIQSAARRPVENGSGSASPAGVSLRNLSKAQREELRQRIHTAAALGEKIYP